MPGATLILTNKMKKHKPIEELNYILNINGENNEQ